MVDMVLAVQCSTAQRWWIASMCTYMHVCVCTVYMCICMYMYFHSKLVHEG